MADRDESLPDFAALLRELLGRDAQLPPEMEQFLAAMQGGRRLATSRDAAAPVGSALRRRW